MSIGEPFTDLDIKKEPSGFYKGNSLPIALISKGIMVALVLWAIIWPSEANNTLGAWNSALLGKFNGFYIVATGAFLFFLLIVAIIPSTGKKLMGKEGVKPEFSNFSWFSMMFGAGLGVGLMVFATAEPLTHWSLNPQILMGEAEPNSAEAVASSYRITFLHYGFHAWAIYVVTGLCLAYFAYTREMPLTIRSALTPLLGRFANGFIGHIVDVLGVVATILGVSVTIGFGIAQFVNGVYAITGMQWMMDLTGEVPKPDEVGLIAALIIIMGMSIISAVSGVGRGVKYLSNLNLVLSLILLLTFVIFGSFFFAMNTYVTAFIDYIAHIFQLSFIAQGTQSVAEFTAALPEAAKPFAADLYGGTQSAWGSFDGFKSGLTDGAAALPDDVLMSAYAAGLDGRLFSWQSGWTTFYWAWWIAFSPFVGLFLARISKGRSVREFIVGCLIAPALVCFAWMTILGATSIDLELSGIAKGSIIAATNEAKLFETLKYMLDGAFLNIIIVMCVVLVMTFLVTSADSGILVMNTIMSGGEQETGIKHRIIWGVLLTLVIGTLLVAGGGGLDAIKNAMIIGALPFTVVMVLMCVSLAKAMYRDGIRDKQ
jgi:choline-glycine betaine transporter